MQHHTAKDCNQAAYGRDLRCLWTWKKYEKIAPPSADLDQPYQCIALHPHEPHTELFKSFHYLRISVQHASMDRCLLQPTCSQMATVQVSQLSSVLTVSRLARDLHDMPTSCQLHPPAYQRHLAILQDESCHLADILLLCQLQSRLSSLDLQRLTIFSLLIDCDIAPGKASLLQIDGGVLKYGYLKFKS